MSINLYFFLYDEFKLTCHIKILQNQNVKYLFVKNVNTLMYLNGGDIQYEPIVVCTDIITVKLTIVV